MQRIGFGGGCHWCTEAIFQSLHGVEKVEQGWIASGDAYPEYSEAVIVHFDENRISLATLIEIHLHTHSSTSNHIMRDKYRSAVYYFTKEQDILSKEIIRNLQQDFELPIITIVLPLVSFKENTDVFTNYYYKDPNKPFCITMIQPKLTLLMKQYAQHYKDYSATKRSI